MKKLSDAQAKLIEEYWTEIDEYRKKLKFREWELTENHSTDTNIGGGKANTISDPTAQRAILLANDERYQNYQRIIKAIDGLYPQLDDDQKTIVQMRYWDKQECYEWQHIADKLYMSVQRVLRKRNNLVDETAKRLGWI